MDTENYPNSNYVFIEAPASWNTRYITPEGFECQLTLRGEIGQELMEKAQSAIAFLMKSGCTPSTYNKNAYHPQAVNNEQSQINGNGANGNGNGNGHGQSWCPIHKCEMKRWDKDGRVWYSHKVGNEWCSGKAKS